MENGDVTGLYGIPRQVAYQAAEFVANAELPSRKEEERQRRGGWICPVKVDFILPGKTLCPLLNRKRLPGSHPVTMMRLFR